MPEIMGQYDIAFPNLGIYLKNIPKNFQIFGFTIAFYGVIIAIAVIAGILITTHEAKITKQDPDSYWDFAIYAIIFSVIGARIYYVVFEWESYVGRFWSIFNLREGGLAIYGGVIGGFITMAIYAKLKKKPFTIMADTAVLGLVLGQIIGRYANFMNREAFGGYTSSLFSMRIPVEMVRTSDISKDIADHILPATNYIQVHPTFFYESMWNVALLIGILLYRKYKKFNGEIALLYLAGYGLGRFFIEGLRTDQLILWNTNIAVSQALGLIAFIAGTTAIVVIRIHLKKKDNKKKA